MGLSDLYQNGGVRQSRLGVEGRKSGLRQCRFVVLTPRHGCHGFGDVHECLRPSGVMGPVSVIRPR